MAERVALITGGVRGIGRAIAVSLSKRGWSVAAAYRTSAEDALSLEMEVKERGGRALTVRADVSRPDGADRLVRHVESEWGRIDALVNCAGPYRRVPILEESVEGWLAVFDNNLHPVFYLSRLAAVGMKDRGWGRIVNFGMANAGQLAGQPYVTAYYAAKVAVLVLTKSLAKALAPHGITVNAVSPGVIDSGSIPLSEFADLARNIPAGYAGMPQDAAEVVCFLLSDEARYVTGANIPVSGGWGV
ncbi:MAG: SDR family oxidoreductase [Acidobacteria bacterium]|nr:SDR family oxidoreductase [Acidobacteriota bacterium]